MRVLREPISEWSVDVPTAIAVGVFDGVHAGHAYILDLVTERVLGEGGKIAMQTMTNCIGWPTLPLLRLCAIR